MSFFRNVSESWRTNPWLPTIMIVIGILCVGGLAVSAFFRASQNGQSGQELPEKVGSLATSSLQAALVLRATQAISSTPAANQTVTRLTDTPTAVPLPAETARPVARFGDICFEAQISEVQTITCGEIFPPVIEVHAIFNYVAMLPQDEWTRVWYHNGAEVLRVKDIWTGDTEGQFDYNLNTSDGQPLSSGLWQLELFVDGRLQTFGSFVVEAPIEPTSTATRIPVTPSPTTAAPGSTFQLAFTKWDGGKHSVWVANLDGSDPQFLLDFAASPSWSPDGQSIVFYGEEGIDAQDLVVAGTNGIWRMGPNGETPTQLLPEGTGQAVAWSPLGDAIAFDAARGGPDRRVYFINLDGSPQNFELLGQHPSWSPDGRQLVTKVCRPECGLWLANRNDTTPRQLTGEGSDGLPAWSPDGRKIAFSRNVEGNVDIFTINVDGTGFQRLTSAPENDSVPAWTPDGRQIVFRSTRNGLWQIFIMGADGSNQRMIIDNVGASDEWAFDRMSVH